MPYGYSTGSGATLAATGFAAGYLWLVVVGLVLVVAGALLVRVSFRRDRGPLER
ncbi:LPXTG cell wall anchor domain-containing protein [Nocardiopsis sp. NPDC006198]|jgi:LPXTG-motif cell wall-anchored protein|uniref:LPXTG cell wall anchor domain-containing protein n=1 Tax=Streptomonospora nanhaiensis TaxID=1323731 RepID=A0ABY6YF08_9ACTN|nr:LPXTG cell wall anchor domain-containing protein [Streptomonospora nanhaiensis]WAE70821.1 LPXTG cell wall anchor domain-containing protein [Streptomonospora nanhaiensis]